MQAAATDKQQLGKAPKPDAPRITDLAGMS